jgi:hypothetical protein
VAQSISFRHVREEPAISERSLKHGRGSNLRFAWAQLATVSWAGEVAFAGAFRRRARSFRFNLRLCQRTVAGLMKSASPMSEFLRPCEASSRMRASWGVRSVSTFTEFSLRRSDSNSETTARGAQSSPRRIAKTTFVKTLDENRRPSIPRQPSRSSLVADATSTASLFRIATMQLPFPCLVSCTISELGSCSRKACFATSIDTFSRRQRDNTCSHSSGHLTHISLWALQKESLRRLR